MSTTRHVTRRPSITISNEAPPERGGGWMVEACEWANGEGYSLSVTNGANVQTIDLHHEQWSALVSAVAGLESGEAR